MEKLYKELTLMGVLALGLIMINASQDITHELSQFIIAFEFVHIILFFTTLSFVFHALFLMYISYGSYKNNIYMSWIDEGKLLKSYQNMNLFDTFLFKYLPYFSSIREAIEYKCLELLFVDTYWLPADFDVPVYISGCFERYALKTVEVGVFNWGVLLFIIFLNYLRVEWRLGFNCNNPEDYSDQLILGTTDSKIDTDTLHLHHNPNRVLMSNNDFDYHSYAYNVPYHRTLAAAGNNIEPVCYDRLTYFFFLCSLALITYCLGLLAVAKTYEARLIRRIGIRSIDDYTSFLKSMHSRRSSREKQEINAGFLNDGRATMEELLEEIEEVADEHEEEEEDEIKFKVFLRNARYIYDGFKEVVMRCKSTISLFINKTFYPHRVASKITKQNTAGILKVNLSKATSQNDMEEGNNLGRFERVRELKKKLQTQGENETVLERLSLIRKATQSENDDVNNSSKNKDVVGQGQEQEQGQTRSAAPFNLANMGSSTRNFQVKTSKEARDSLMKLRGARQVDDEVLPNYSDTDTDISADEDTLKEKDNKNDNDNDDENEKDDSDEKLSNVGTPQKVDTSDAPIFSGASPMSPPVKKGKARKTINDRIAEIEITAEKSATPQTYVRQRRGSIDAMHKAVGKETRKQSVFGQIAGFFSHSGTENERRVSDAGSISLSQRNGTSNHDQLSHIGGKTTVSLAESGTSDLANFRKQMDEEHRAAEILDAHLVSDSSMPTFLKSKSWRRLSISGKLKSSKVTVEPTIPENAKLVLNNDNDNDKDEDLDLQGLSRKDSNIHHSVKTIADILGVKDEKSLSSLSNLHGQIEVNNADLYSSDFDNIYIFGSPKLYDCAVEACIMLHCFYLGVWSTNFITITSYSTLFVEWWEIMIILPVVLISLPALARINMTNSTLQAVANMNLAVMQETVHTALEATEQTANLRESILQRVNDECIPYNDHEEKLILVDSLFGTVDIDGSGAIDQYEFRILLRQLELNYSDKKFHVLFSAIDIEAAGEIKKYEFYNLLFPCTKKDLRDLIEYYRRDDNGEIDEDERQSIVPKITNCEKLRPSQKFTQRLNSKQ